MSSSKYTNHSADFDKTPVIGNIRKVDSLSSDNNGIEELTKNIQSLSNDTIVIDEFSPSYTETKNYIIDIPTPTEFSSTQCLPTSPYNNTSKLDKNIEIEGLSKLDTNSSKSSHESIIQGQSMKSSSSTLIVYNSNTEGYGFSI